MLAILPQNEEKRRFRSQKNLVMEASSHFPDRFVKLHSSMLVVIWTDHFPLVRHIYYIRLVAVRQVYQCHLYQ